jgi:chemotaxis protein histidine kinase CheA
MSIDNEILSYFIEESTELLNGLNALGESLKNVKIPNEEESKRLAEFAQKLNRLIGGTASVGFDMFTPLSRKTSILAEKCAEVTEITIKLLVLNLNMVISVLSECFNDLESISKIENQIPDLEKRIDMCLASVGIVVTDLINQNQIDDLLASFNL